MLAKVIKNSIRKNLNSEQQSEFDSKCEDIQEKLSDATTFFSIRVNNVKNRAIDTYNIVKNGYTSYEIWNFGDYITIRMANLCAYLYDAQYAQEPAYKGELLENERVFQSIGGFDSMMMDSGHVDLVSYQEMFDIEEKAYKDVFLPAWMWVFDNLMSPDVYVAPEKPQNRLSINQAAREKFTNEVAYADVANLPVTEMKRMAKILKKMADNTHGHPDSYAKNDKALMTIEERGGSKWEDGQSLALGFLTHSSKYWREYIWSCDNRGFLCQRSRKELGVDWVAWIEDILHAADVFEIYAEWFDAEPKDKKDMKLYMSSHAHPMSLRDSMFLLEPEAAKDIEEKLVAETRKVWEWMGRDIRAFWD